MSRAVSRDPDDTLVTDRQLPEIKQVLREQWRYGGKPWSCVCDVAGTKTAGVTKYRIGPTND